MNTTLELEQKQTSAMNLPGPQSQPLRSAEAPEISRSAWKVIIFLMVGGAVLLATVAAYVFSGLYRFQDCL